MTDETGTSHRELSLSDWVSASTEQELREFAAHMAWEVAMRADEAAQNCDFFLYAALLVPPDFSEITLSDKFRRVCCARDEDLLWRPPSVVPRLLFHDVTWLALAALAVFLFWSGALNVEHTRTPKGDHISSVLAGALLVGAGRAFSSALGAARAQRANAISCRRVRQTIQLWAQAATIATQYVADAVLDAATYTTVSESDVYFLSARVRARFLTAHRNKEEP